MSGRLRHRRCEPILRLYWPNVKTTLPYTRCPYRTSFKPKNGFTSSHCGPGLQGAFREQVLCGARLGQNKDPGNADPSQSTPDSRHLG